MRDFLGNEIKIGDIVVLHGGIRLMKAEVIDFSYYWTSVQLKDSNGFTSTKCPSDLVVVTSIIPKYSEYFDSGKRGEK